MTRRRILFAAGGLVAAAALAYAAAAIAPGQLAASIGGAETITPGFLGVAQFGQWRLICMPGPQRLETLALTEEAAGSGRRTNSCRVNQEIALPGEPEDSAQPIAAANFSFVGPKGAPAVMIRIPATAKPGDRVSFRSGNDVLAQTFVRDCTEKECIAAGPLPAEAWSRLLSASSMQIGFPASNGQHVLLDVPSDGLLLAAAALRKAQENPF